MTTGGPPSTTKRSPIDGVYEVAENLTDYFSCRPWESGCAGNDACRTIYTDVMRGERKKSREKLRRMEVNGKVGEVSLGGFDKEAADA